MKTMIDLQRETLRVLQGLQTSFEGLRVELRAVVPINDGPRDRVELPPLQPQRDLLNQCPLNLEMPIHRHIQRELDDSSD